MKKILVMSALCAAAVVSTTSIDAQALDLSAAKNMAGTVQATASALTPDAAKGQIKAINAQVAAANATVTKSKSVLEDVLSDKATLKKYKEDLAKANSITDPKEKAAAIKQANKDKAAADKAYQASEEYKQALEKLTASQIDGVLTATLGLATAADQYMAIAKECQSLAMKISTNPTLAVPLASDLSELKNTIVVVKDGLKELKNTTVAATKACNILGVGDKLKEKLDAKKASTSKASGAKKVNLPLGK